MLKGIIFDMDGTITVPYIDWKALRARIGASPDQTILEHIDSLPPKKSAWAHDVLVEAEREAAENACINEGVHELLSYLVRKSVRTALVTNNHREAMHTVIRSHNLHFDVALSRNDGELKPSPALITKALEAMGLTAECVVGIGDGRYDLESCRRAGVRCIYLTHGNPVLDHEPRVADLHDARHLLDTDGFADRNL